MKVSDVLKMAYSMEIGGMEFYNSQKEKVKSSKLGEIFTYLANMEKSHAEFLKRQIEKSDRGEKLDFLPESKEDSMFIDRMKQQKVETSNLDDDLGDFSIIRMAYLIERDFEKFYRKASEEAEEKEIKAVFAGLAKWEEGHAEMLKNELEDIIARNSIELGFYPL